MKCFALFLLIPTLFSAQSSLAQEAVSALTCYAECVVIKPGFVSVLAPATYQGDLPPHRAFQEMIQECMNTSQAAGLEYSGRLYGAYEWEVVKENIPTTEYHRSVKVLEHVSLELAQEAKTLDCANVFILGTHPNQACRKK